MKNEDDIYFLLPELRTNGMRIKSGRQVFYGWIFLGVFKLYCQTCGNIELDFDDSGETVSELVSAIDSWVKRSPETEFGCPVCGTQKPLEDWDFGDTLAFGNLGFEFWNWPTFKDSFISDISSLLGYDVKVVSGKI